MSSHSERHPPMGSESDKENPGGSNAPISSQYAGLSASSSSEEIDEISLRVKALLADIDEQTPTISHQRMSSPKQEQPTTFQSIEFETEVILTSEGFSCPQQAVFSMKPEEVPNTQGTKVSGNIGEKDENFSLTRYSDCDTPPLSSVASCKNLDWDNAADIGYIADTQTESNSHKKDRNHANFSFPSDGFELIETSKCCNKAQKIFIDEESDVFTEDKHSYSLSITDRPCAKEDFSSDTKRDISEDKTLKEKTSLQSNILSSAASEGTYSTHQDTNQQMRSELSVRPKEKSFLKSKSKFKKKYTLSKQKSSSFVPNLKSEKSKCEEEREPLISQPLINQNMYKSMFGTPFVLGNISEDNLIELAAPDEHSIPVEHFVPHILHPDDLSEKYKSNIFSSPPVIDSILLATYEQNTRSSADISSSEDLPYFRWCPVLKSQDIRNASTQTSTKKSNEQGTSLDFHDVSSQNISQDSDAAQHLLIQRNTLNMYSLPLSEYKKENITSYIVPENVKTSDVKCSSGVFVPSEIQDVESRPPFEDDSDLVKYSHKSTVSPPNIKGGLRKETEDKTSDLFENLHGRSSVGGTLNMYSQSCLRHPDNQSDKGKNLRNTCTQTSLQLPKVDINMPEVPDDLNVKCSKQSRVIESFHRQSTIDEDSQNVYSLSPDSQSNENLNMTSKLSLQFSFGVQKYEYMDKPVVSTCKAETSSHEIELDQKDDAESVAVQSLNRANIERSFLYDPLIFDSHSSQSENVIPNILSSNLNRKLYASNIGFREDSSKDSSPQTTASFSNELKISSNIECCQNDTKSPDVVQQLHMKTGQDHIVTLESTPVSTSRSHMKLHSGICNEKIKKSSSTETYVQDCMFDERIIQHSSTQMYLPHSMPDTKVMKDSSSQTLIEGVDVPIFTYDLSKKESYLISTSLLSHMYLPSNRQTRESQCLTSQTASKYPDQSDVKLHTNVNKDEYYLTNTFAQMSVKEASTSGVQSQELEPQNSHTFQDTTSSSEEKDIRDILPKTSTPFSKDIKLYSSMFKDTPPKGIPLEKRSTSMSTQTSLPSLKKDGMLSETSQDGMKSRKNVVKSSAEQRPVIKMESLITMKSLPLEKFNYRYLEEKAYENVANTKHVRGKADVIHGGQDRYSSDPDINHPGSAVDIKKVDLTTTADRFQDAATNYKDNDNREKFLKKIHKVLDDAQRKKAYDYHKQLLKELRKKDENVSLHSKNFDIILSDDNQTVVESDNSPLHFNPTFMRPLKRSKKKAPRRSSSKSPRKPAPRPKPLTRKELKRIEEHKKILRMIYRDRAKRFSTSLAQSASKGKVDYSREERVVKGASGQMQ